MAMVERGEASTYHVSWGAIFGGAVLTLGLWILLHTLGLAAGLTAIDPDNPGSLRGAGIGTGIWSIVAPLIALFVGGMVSARTAGIADRMTGAIQGSVMWALTMLAGSLLVTMALFSAVGAGMRVGKAVAGAAGSVPTDQAAEALGVQVDDLLGPVNERMRAQGLAPVTAQQIRDASRDAVQRGLREGRLDREVLIGSLVANTRLERAEAEAIAGRLETQVAEAGQRVKQGALQAAETTGKALWGVFFALFLGLCSAVAGAITGVSRRQRIAAEAVPVTPAPVVTTPPVVHPPRLT